MCWRCCGGVGREKEACCRARIVWDLSDVGSMFPKCGWLGEGEGEGEAEEEDRDC